ncbi:MAG: ABC transporter ATP-binding protein [Actinomycetaceae bacterium]|nr:ABC transporter ATP-binding protein [Actinomycetaceae bacterium]MDY6142824.1 ABC transporter ATP-binding protein [Arcanobacterium sp.]
MSRKSRSGDSTSPSTQDRNAVAHEGVASSGVSISIDALSFSYTQGDQPPTVTTGDAAHAPNQQISEERTVLADALRSVNLQVQSGECLLLTGPSGGGKSSIIRLLNGLIPHYYHGLIDGSISIEDHEGRAFHPSTEPLWRTGEVAATVFQNPRTQFFTTDVTSEIAFALENQGLPAHDILQRVRNAAAQAGISELLGRSLFKLSGGERQLVACAAALAQRPQLYLFDEPTSNLSDAATERFAAFVKHIKSEGATVIITEHRTSYLRGVADRVALIDGGVTAHLGAEEFFTMPDGQRQSLGLRSFDPPQVSDLITEHLVYSETGKVYRDSNTLNHGTPSTTGATQPFHTEERADGISISHLDARYGRNRVLSIEHLSIRRGEVTAIVGANGVGKSTFAHVLCGLKKARGEIALDAVPLSPKQRIARSYMVMQDVHRQLFSDTVLGEVMLGHHHIRKADGDHAGAPLPPGGLNDSSHSVAGFTPRVAMNLLAHFDLDDDADRHPLSLSGGQKQRLVIAAATALDRDVYVFDEPSSGLDYARLVATAQTLRSLAEQGKVVVLITHDSELLEQCADRVIEFSSCRRSY